MALCNLTAALYNDVNQIDGENVNLWLMLP
jgi:hypothetical protein